MPLIPLALCLPRLLLRVLLHPPPLALSLMSSSALGLSNALGRHPSSRPRSAPRPLPVGGDARLAPAKSLHAGPSPRHAAAPRVRRKCAPRQPKSFLEKTLNARETAISPACPTTAPHSGRTATEPQTLRPSADSRAPRNHRDALRAALRSLPIIAPGFHPSEHRCVH